MGAGPGDGGGPGLALERKRVLGKRPARRGRLEPPGSLRAGVLSSGPPCLCCSSRWRGSRCPASDSLSATGRRVALLSCLWHRGHAGQDSAPALGLGLGCWPAHSEPSPHSHCVPRGRQPSCWPPFPGALTGKGWQVWSCLGLEVSVSPAPRGGHEARQQRKTSPRQVWSFQGILLSLKNSNNKTHKLKEIIEFQKFKKNKTSYPSYSSGSPWCHPRALSPWGTGLCSSCPAWPSLPM